MSRPVRWRVAVAAIALWLVPWPASAQSIPAPACYVGYVTELRKAIGNAAEADEFFLTVHGYSEVARAGTADMLKYVGGEDFYRAFDDIESLVAEDALPFGDTEALFVAVREAVQGHVPGITGKIGSLRGGPSNVKGTALDLWVVQDIAGPTRDFARVSGFETSFEVTAGRTRRYDVVETSGRRHENKNWSQGIPPASSDAYKELLDEFRDDILLDGANGFASTRYNFFCPCSPDVLKQELLTLFEGEEVVRLLGQRLPDAKKAFEAMWRQGGLWKTVP